MSERIGDQNLFPMKSKHDFVFSQKAEKKPSWLLARLWRKPDDTQVKLSIKVYSIKPEAEQAHHELMKILANFSSNDNLYPYVKEVVDPLLREIDQILNKLQYNLTDDALERYSQWTAKARRWVDLCAKVSEEKLREAVTDHIILRSLELIDRDINFIIEYASNQNPTANIGPFISDLETLKVKPNLPLEEISKWKQNFDRKRESVVNSAYHAIDTSL